MRLAVVLASVLYLGCSDPPSHPPDLGPSPNGAAAAKTGAAPAAAVPAAAPLNPRLMRRFPPLQPAPQASTEIVDLGRMLFYDKRLSRAGDVSCNSCHLLDKYGVDQLVTSVGHGAQRGDRNAPSVYHAAGQVAQFWDGRSPDIIDQAGKPITNPGEMAMQSPAEVVARLLAIPGYVDAFRAAYPNDPDPVTFAHLTEAIGTFEGGLLTPARWDRYLNGDRSALTADEVEGFRLFADIGCVECHTGEKLGGSMFQKAGRMRPWPDATDGGRWKVTKDEADRMVFKVPSLRNIERTGPYFHDGSVATLEAAVIAMAQHQLDLDIVAWLKSLTGELPTGYIAEPALPPDPIATP